MNWEIENILITTNHINNSIQFQCPLVPTNKIIILTIERREKNFIFREEVWDFHERAHDG